MMAAASSMRGTEVHCKFDVGDTLECCTETAASRNAAGIWSFATQTASCQLQQLVCRPYLTTTVLGTTTQMCLSFPSMEN